MIDISCGAGSLLIPWKDSGALLVGADIDEEALELCKENLPNAILFKHNSLECDTPCHEISHIFSVGNISLERMWEILEDIESGIQGEKIFVMNPPFSLAGKMVSKVLELAENKNE